MKQLQTNLTYKEIVITLTQEESFDLLRDIRVYQQNELGEDTVLDLDVVENGTIKIQGEFSVHNLGDVTIEDIYEAVQYSNSSITQKFNSIKDIIDLLEDEKFEVSVTQDKTKISESPLSYTNYETQRTDSEIVIPHMRHRIHEIADSSEPYFSEWFDLQCDLEEEAIDTLASLVDYKTKDNICYDFAMEHLGKVDFKQLAKIHFKVFCEKWNEIHKDSGLGLLIDGEFEEVH